MGLNAENRGFCLGSAEIRNLVKEGRIISPDFDENRIQPSSFEPTIDDFVFRLNKGIFRTNEKETVRTSLIKTPAYTRERMDIRKGGILSKGFDYLVPLREKIILNLDEQIKSSPKSSLGRIFLNTRLCIDYSSGYDELTDTAKPGTALDLWLLVQPLAFDVIVKPGLSLNQMRFFKGYDSMLNSREVIEEFRKKPLLYVERGEKLVAAKHSISDSLMIHLDLKGKHTGGIVGLKALPNSDSIDLSSEELCDTQRFFEPIKARKGTISIDPGENYLLVSEEFIKIPEHLNGELAVYTSIGINGPVHFAGFFDNGFEGNGVLEVRSNETTKMSLTHGMPISKLNLFRTLNADKSYGEGIGSSYKGQAGIRTAKYFKPVDYNKLGKNYKRLNEQVLVQDAKIISNFLGKDGFRLLDPQDHASEKSLDGMVSKGFFHRRADCEMDEEVRQIIPYIIILGPDRTIFQYERAESMKDFPEERLLNKKSLGVGGHIKKEDSTSYVKNCISRKIGREVVAEGIMGEPKLVGTIMVDDNPVDKFHVGLVYAVLAEGDVDPKDRSLKKGSLAKIDEVIKSAKDTNLETWSRILIPYLLKIYEIAKRS